MKLSILIGALSATFAIASPAAGSLKRAFKEVKEVGTPTTANPSGTIQIACVECPCGGFDGACECVAQGCCCDWTLPTATGWRAGWRD